MSTTVTRFRYEMDVTVHVDTSRGYYPEQPITVNGFFDWAGPAVNRAAAQARLLNDTLDAFCRDAPGYTRNHLLKVVDDRRWSVVTGGTVTRFDFDEVSA